MSCRKNCFKNILKSIFPYDIIVIKIFKKDKDVENNLFESGNIKLSCIENELNGKNRMEELKISLEQAVEKLISMFEETGRQYSCTRTKIGKLLSIFAFKEACMGNKAFSENIVKYSNCGTTIDELVFYVPREVYFSNESNDSSTIITDYQMPQTDLEWLSVLYSVFIHFGAYSSQELGKQISFILTIQEPKVLSDSETVQLNAIQELYRFNFYAIPHKNALINFLIENNG